LIGILGESPFVSKLRKAESANSACTGRLGLAAFLELVLSFDSFPFPGLFLRSRTPKGHNASH
jgi:hypothetical protein